MNGGVGESQSVNVGVAADTGAAAVAEASTIDFTVDGKEGLFQVPHPTISAVLRLASFCYIFQWLCRLDTLLRPRQSSGVCSRSTGYSAVVRFS